MHICESMLFTDISVIRTAHRNLFSIYIFLIDTIRVLNNDTFAKKILCNTKRINYLILFQLFFFRNSTFNFVLYHLKIPFAYLVNFSLFNETEKSAADLERRKSNVSMCLSLFWTANEFLDLSG